MQQIDPNSIQWDDAPQATRQPAPQPNIRVIGDIPSSERRAERDQELQEATTAQQLTRGAQQIQAAELDLQTRQIELAEREMGAKLGKEAGFYLRAANAAPLYDQLNIGPEGQFRASVNGVVPENWMNQFTSEQRQLAETYMRDFISASLRYESGAAIGEAEFENQARIYFPQAGDSDEVVAAKRQLRQTMVESLKLGAGPKAAQTVEQFLNSKGAGAPKLEASTDGTFSTEEDFAVAGTIREIYEGGGSLGEMIEASRALGRPVSMQQAKAWKEAIDYRTQTGKFAQVAVPESGQATGFQQGMTDFLTSAPGAALAGVADFTGGIDEAAAAVSSTFSDRTYDEELERINSQKQVVQEASPYAYTGGQIAGGIASGLGLARAAPSVTSAATSTVGRTAATSGAVGATQGALEQNDNRAAGAIVGGTLGAALGGAGAKVVDGIASRRAAGAASQESRAAIQQAGQAEGVTVNRAMTDPSLENTITAVDASSRGPRLRAGIDEVAGQIEGRVDGLSPIPNQNLNREAVGDISQDALERVRERSGQQARQQYERASKIAGDVRIQPTQAIQAIDGHIAELTEAGANSNRTLIKYLEDVKADLSREGGMTVDALRAQRTGLRGQISERSLSATDAERRVGEVLDAAAEDIATGLDGGALQAFRDADTAWRERSQFIKQIERQLVGGDASNPISGDAAGRKIETWMRGDGTRLSKFWRSLEGEERDQIASSVAYSLGRNNAGDFSAAQFVNQLTGKNRTVSDRTIRLIFGDEGLESINNLKILADEVKRVQGAMNSRSSGSGVAAAGDMRGWLANLLIQGGGLAGFGFGQDLASAATGAAVGGALIGGKVLRDNMVLKALLTPEITRWAARAPRTANPRAIDRHFGRLQTIAGGNTAAAAPAEALVDMIMRAANDNAGMSLVAEDQIGEE